MFKNKFKQIVALLLLSVLLLATVSCDSNKDDKTQETQEPVVTTDQNSDDSDNSGEEEYITLYQNRASCFNMVFGKDIDMTLPRYTSAKDFCIQLCTIFGATMGTPTAPKLMSDVDYVENQDQIEILWGKTACKESVQVYEEIGLNEYGFRIIGNKIVIYGNTLDELKIGAEALRIQLNENAYLDDNGNVVGRIPADAKKEYSIKDLAILELPKPSVAIARRSSEPSATKCF